MAVKWDVVDSLGNRKEEYYEGECLIVGTKNDCGLFIDRLKANREQAAINNKEGRTRKKPTKLLDYTADPIEEGSLPAKITERVTKKLSPRKETSDSEGKPAETLKGAPRHCKRSSVSVSDSEESFSCETGSVSSSDEAEYKPPKNKHKKVKKLNSTEQQPTAKKRKHVSKGEKLTKEVPKEPG